MEEKSKIPALFGTQQNYEQFQLEWALLCYRLNPSETNRRRLEQVVFSKRTME